MVHKKNHYKASYFIYLICMFPNIFFLFILDPNELNEDESIPSMSITVSLKELILCVQI